jgi:hypothetical protein
LAGGKEVFPHRLSRFELNSQTARDKSPWEIDNLLTVTFSGLKNDLHSKVLFLRQWLPEYRKCTLDFL